MSDADKPALKPANDNPWYCLATMHGEQAAEFDEELASKNRLAWNRWISTDLSDEERASLVKNGFPEPQLAPMSPEEKSAFCRAFADRIGRETDSPPEPTEKCDFTFTHFDRWVSFDGFLFRKHTDFGSATFSHIAELSATFCGRASFYSVTFSDAYFGSATFSDSINFNSATFTRDADFTSATFSGDAFFSSAKFSGEGDFSSAKFFGDAVFQWAEFGGFATFSSAMFLSFLTFLNARFKTITAFDNADFRTNVPDFRGATMHEGTEWHGAIWPTPPPDSESAQNQVYAYERLKQEMERLKKHEDEQLFFRKELRARRGTESLLSAARLLNFLYWVLSDYGQSIGRPLIWLFGLFTIGGAVFYAMNPNMPSAALRLEAVPHAAALSFGYIFPFIPITHEIISAIPVAGLSWAEKIVGVAQSVLGTPLLFLLGLALRNRFRMR
jgi:hypothetical protein